MKWSWKIARIDGGVGRLKDGVELRIHLTFLVLIAWLAVSYWITGRSLHSVIAGVGFILALFACVLLHEFGHVLAARQFGIRTRDITLLPIGGLARLERMPEVPSHEAWIAAAGPAVNLAIAAVLDSWLMFMNTWQPFSQVHLTTGPWLERLLVANVTLVIFNLIPAFPMDGDRILRALLSSRMGHTRGTEVAVSVGQVFAFVMGLIGLFLSPMLLLIGLFVWIGAAQEANAVHLRAALSDTPARAVMLTDFATLEAGDRLSEAVRLTLNGSQRDFPVVDTVGVIGMVSGSGLLGALAAHGLDQPVTVAMRTEFPVAESSEPLESVFRRLQDHGADAIPVIDNGLIVGMITMENVQEYLLIRATLKVYNGRTAEIRRGMPVRVAGD